MPSRKLTIRSIAAPKLPVGQRFVIPLVDDAGYGFGYVALAREKFGYLLDIYDAIAETPTPPDDLNEAPLALRNLLQSGGCFLTTRNNTSPWLLIAGSAGTVHPVEKRHYRVGSKVFDALTGAFRPTDPIADESLPDISYPLDNRHSYMVTALLLGCDYRFNPDKTQYELLR